jgi:hypothetical protein
MDEKPFDIRPMVWKYAELPSERLQVITDISYFKLDEIRCGILFVFAPWSNYAVYALRQLTRLLSKVNLGDLQIIVLDHDCMTDKDMLRLFGHAFYGNGETLWIRARKVIAESSAYPKQAMAIIVQNTRQLLG